ncbi:MAG: nitrous oxide reductase family maturation protein NosD [Pseudomonadales bacterium]|nr:nitrous oxide reductase family maturation protein NosD [Pseudomonadales bacterium]
MQVVLTTKNRAAHFWVALFFLISVFGCYSASADTITVKPNPGAFANAVAKAHPGDQLNLLPGLYTGKLVIDKTLIITGQPGTVIQGDGSGNVITVSAPNVKIQGLIVENSGDQLSTEDSGIFLTKESVDSIVSNNILRNNLIGIYLKGSENVIVRNNTISGRQYQRVNDRGNGVQIWNAPGAIIEGNTIEYGRDGIFVTTSHHNIFRNNRFTNLRYAIHYMYTHHSEVSGNFSTNNHIAYALMFSDYLNVFDNISVNDRDRAVLLNFVNYSTIANNRAQGVGNNDLIDPNSKENHITEKCIFFYNSNMNTVQDNYLSGCEIGIHFTAGSQDNQLFGNAFINNRTQVKYVGTRHIEWSSEGRGNYWSDHPAFDLNDDNIADQSYRPNDLTDQLIWRHPIAKLLLNSPSMQILRWAQSEFPGLHPGGIKDSFPLMTIPVQMDSVDG